MGPRIREDNEGKGNKIPRLRFAALGMTCGPGRRRGMDSRLRLHEGRLYAGITGVGARTGGGGRGWVPASARTTDGEGMDSRPRLHWGRPRAGITGVGAGMTGRGFCGAGAVAGGRPQGSPLRRRGLRVRQFFAGPRIALAQERPRMRIELI